MLNYKNDILSKIDSNIYASACEEAKELAPTCGKVGKYVEAKYASVPHDISNYIDEMNLNDKDKSDLLFIFFNELPVYAILMSVNFVYMNCEIDIKEYILSRLYEYLDTDNPIYKVPVEYSLWCDYFEDYRNQEFVWDYLTKLSEKNYKVLKSILLMSGPIKFSLKDKLYKKLLKDRSMHESIFESLLHSKFDYFGNYDENKANKVFSKLKIDKSSEKVQVYLSKI